MSKFIIDENIKNEILNQYFLERKNKNEISKNTKISRYIVGKILEDDDRYENEKIIREQDRFKKPKVNQLIFYKSKQSYNVKVSIPYSYIEKLGLNINDKFVEIKLNEENKEIIITKKEEK